jgi:hypothetical protein
MKKKWFIDEVVLKLPLLNIKLKAPISDSIRDLDRIVLSNNLPMEKLL